jgi:hypothetical protein
MVCPHCANEKIKCHGNIKLFTETVLGYNEYMVSGWECLKCHNHFYLDIIGHRG